MNERQVELIQTSKLTLSTISKFWRVFTLKTPKAPLMIGELIRRPSRVLSKAFKTFFSINSLLVASQIMPKRVLFVCQKPYANRSESPGSLTILLGFYPSPLGVAITLTNAV